MDQNFLYLIIVAGVSGIVFAMLIRSGWIFGGGRVKTGAKGNLDRDFVAGKWQEIQQLMEQGKPSAYKVAVMDADKLVDYVLKAKVGSDGSMADRLKRAQKIFSNYSDYQNLWSAHKTRNLIAHEATHELLFPEVKRTISYFEKALKSLGAL